MFRTIAATFALAVCAVSAAAASEADFFRGKTITMLIPAGAGGGYDLYGRTMAPHLKRHLPGNPEIIMNYLAGSGGLRAAKKMAVAAPRDGTFIGIPLASVVVSQLIQPKRVDFNVAELSWLGTIAELNSVISVWHTTGVKSLDDAKKKEVVLGATQKGSFLYQQPAIVNALLGTKFRMVMGYKASRDLDIALERGEIGGRAQFWSSWQASHPAWLAEGKLVQLVQVGNSRIKELPNVPSLSDLVKTDEDRAMLDFLYINTAMARTLYAPPNLPAARLATLRKAVGDMVVDPAFLKDMAKRKLPVNPGSAEDLEAFVKRVLKTPAPVVAKLKTVLGIK